MDSTPSQPTPPEIIIALQRAIANQGIRLRQQEQQLQSPFDSNQGLRSQLRRSQLSWFSCPTNSPWATPCFQLCHFSQRITPSENHSYPPEPHAGDLGSFQAIRTQYVSIGGPTMTRPFSSRRCPSSTKFP
ncbi:hypothetical protein GOODEAATRI_010148 [Goodea atripinnis]|uniref:Uncharacterized protein n=1 Tax=Goodea atripinnis TaxID=208336 RepID=A0ABV0NLE6_9TELE